jgi:DNA-binding NarL/FixJ family response regulator
MSHRLRVQTQAEPNAAAAAKIGSSMIKVMLLDDHAVVRQGYRHWIDGEPDMRVVAEAATSSQACEIVRQQDIDVAVVDLVLKEDSGLEAMRRMRERRPKLRMLVFTMHDHHDYALQAFRAGASGYITKDGNPQDLLDALRKVASGVRVFSGEVAQASLELADEARASPFAQLTPREFEVLRLATAGYDNSAIARALLVSEKTIHNTMSLIRQKLDVRNDFRLLRMAARHGLTRL